jgi:excisionase family DNA binding protein
MAQATVGEELRWMSPSQAAGALGCSASTITRWVKEGRLAGEASPLGTLVSTEAVEQLRRERAGQ